MNPKNSKKSPIHENADANITCDFGDISRLGVSYLTRTGANDDPTTQKTDSHVDFLNLIVDWGKLTETSWRTGPIYLHTGENK